MKQSDKSKGKSSRLLPLAALFMVALMLVIVFFVPKNAGTDKDETDPANEVNNGSVSQASSSVSEINEDGNLVIYADRLSSEEVSFIRVSENSRIELLARLGDDGTVKAALGTCQSCNGSPGAYYTQNNEELMCNNCGLTFPVSVLDNPGGGCHPIMIKEEIMTYEGNDLVIDLEGLSIYEELFEGVADH